MFSSVALNVVIGLVFIYLLYSLLATTINEAIASIFNLRAKKLQLAITKMLNDGIHTYDNLWELLHDTFEKAGTDLKNFIRFFSYKKKNAVHPKSLLGLFYDHPAIKYLGENKISNKPAYISPDFFSKTLIDVLAQKANNTSDSKINQVKAGINLITDHNETKALIQSLLDDSNNDLDKFKVALELWFNETMYRTTGWYKKQSQRITFCIGFVLAISFNVNTIFIVQKLSREPGSAKLLSDIAIQYAETHKDSAGNLKNKYAESSKELFSEAHRQINEDIRNANSIIGLGWDMPAGTSGVWAKTKYVLSETFSSGKKLLGYLLTALAISFGAPFWFDLLNKLVQLRSAGKKPEDPTVKNESKQTTVKRVG